MDISESYIEMCSNANEIQVMRSYDNCNYKDGDYVRIGFYATWIVMILKEDTNNRPISKSIKQEEIIFFRDGYKYIKALDRTDESKEHKIIWIPRLDQLFDMIRYTEDGFDCNFILILDEFTKFYKDILYNDKQRNSPWASYISYERYLLAFIMKHKYNKYWNSEETKWLETLK